MWRRSDLRASYEAAMRHAKMMNDPVAAQRAALRLGGGEDRIQAHHARGRLTARERIDRFLDADSFQEIAPYVTHRHTDFGLERQRFPGDGVVTGFGLLDGRR